MTDADGAARSSRRGFLAAALVLGGILLAELAWLIVAFLKPRAGARAGGRGGLVTAGPVEQFPPGSVTAFPEGRFYLTRLDDGGFLALRRRCTHLGCTVPWDDEARRFVCPCHASSFDLRGDVLSPPAPRALDLFAVRIENDVVKVDTRQAIRRSAFAPDQVARA